MPKHGKSGLGGLGREPVFTIGGCAYDWADIVLAAGVWNDWKRVEEEARQAIACGKYRVETKQKLGRREVDAEAADFRYARHLVTAKDMEAWLRRWHLSAESWMSYVRRSVLRRKFASSAAGLPEQYPPEPTEVRRAMKAVAICSGHLSRLARKFAEYATAHAIMPDAAPISASAKAIGSIDADFLGLSAQLLQQRLERLSVIKGSYERWAHDIAPPAAVHGQIAIRHTDWLRIDCMRVVFASESEAREAALCVRQDGETLEEVGVRSRNTVDLIRFYLEEVDPSIAVGFLSAPIGQLIGPLDWRGGFSLFLIQAKVAPSSDDPEIRTKAGAWLMHRALEREMTQRVQWVFPI